MKKLFLLAVILLAVNFRVSAQNSSDDITVEKIDKAKLEKILKERNGKVLLLNLWATWCVPCREEFPDLIKIKKEFSGKNLEVVGISIDFPEETDSKIIPFLESQKANFVSYVNAFEKDEDLINMLDKKWNGALPATFIYDAKGNKLIFMEGKRSYGEFKKEVEKALKK